MKRKRILFIVLLTGFTFIHYSWASCSGEYNHSCGTDCCYKMVGTKAVIQDGSTYIRNEAFYGSSITSIDIPASITTIGDSAFNRAYNLTEVTFEEGSQLTTLGSAPFYWTAISSLTLPEGVVNIGQYAFHAMPNLTELTISDQTILPWNSLKNNPWGEPTVDFSKTTFKCAGVLETCKANLLVGGLQDGTFNLVQTSYKRKNEDGTYNYYDENGDFAAVYEYDKQGNYKIYDTSGKLIATYLADNTLQERYSHGVDGSVSIYDKNGKLIGLQGKRILTVEEATALVKDNKNTFKLKYR